MSDNNKDDAPVSTEKVPLIGQRERAETENGKEDKGKGKVDEPAAPHKVNPALAALSPRSSEVPHRRNSAVKTRFDVAAVKPVKEPSTVAASSAEPSPTTSSSAPIDLRELSFEGTAVVDVVNALFNEKGGVDVITKNRKDYVIGKDIVTWIEKNYSWAREKGVQFGNWMLENDILETGDKGGDDFEDSDDAKFRVANLFLLRHGKVSRRTKPRVVILGGGYAGSNVAKNLEDYHRRFDVTLIDEKEYFENTIWVLRMMTEPAIEESVKLFRKLVLPHERYLRRTRIVRGRILEVTVDKVITSTATVFYDYLVIATGASYQNQDIKASSATPDQELFTDFRIKSLSDIALKVQSAKKIAVVGGGVVGTELVGEILSMYDDKEVYFVHSHDRVLPRLDSSISKKVEKYLTKKGATLILNERASATFNANDKKWTLTCASGKVLQDLDLVCWATGQRANTAFMQKNFADYMDEDHRIKVNEYFQLVGHENVFCIGDASAVLEEKKAERALAHAGIVTDHLVAITKGKKLGKAYHTTKYPGVMCISLGRTNSLLLINGKFWADGKIASATKEATFRFLAHQPLSSSGEGSNPFSNTDLAISTIDLKALPSIRTVPRIGVLGLGGRSEFPLLVLQVMEKNDIAALALKEKETKTDLSKKAAENLKSVIVKDFDAARSATFTSAISGAPFLGVGVCLEFAMPPFLTDIARFEYYAKVSEKERLPNLLLVHPTVELTKFEEMSKHKTSSKPKHHHVLALAEMAENYSKLIKMAKAAFSSVTIVQYSGEFEYCLRGGYSKKQRSISFPFGDNKFCWISRADLIEAVLRVALSLEDHKGHVLNLTGPATFVADDVRDGVCISVGEDTELVKPSAEDAVKVMASLQKMSDEDKAAAKSFIQFIVHSPQHEVTQEAEKILQRPPQSFGAWIEAEAHAFY